jgi:guanylate kinase
MLAAQTKKHGNVFVVSAPSGAGKHAVLGRVMALDSGIQYSISATTRSPRPGEVHGKHYYFLDRQDFRRRIEGGEFAEWAEVHGNLYGTFWNELSRKAATGQDVVLELDVQGMRNLTAAVPGAISIFIMPPSMEALERRLRDRGMNSEDEMEVRLGNARAEIAACGSYDYVVVNDNLEEAVADVVAIVRAERCRVGGPSQRSGRLQ